MRRVERIDIILDVLDIKQFLLDLGVPSKIADDCDISVIEDWECFVDQWKLNADLRLTQALINFGHLPNIPGFWYYIEEDEYCIEKGLLKFEEIKFWGKNYDKNNKRLPETQYILLKDITKDHIKAIFKWFKDRGQSLHPQYEEYFKKRLNEKSRGTKVKKRGIKGKVRKTSKAGKRTGKTKVKKSLVR